MSAWPLLLVGLAAVSALMLVVWLLALRWRNAGIVDVAWAGGLALVGSLYAALGPGYAPRRGLAALLVGLWGLRLGWHLGRRIARHHPVEDGRYQQLRKEWAPVAERKFLAFFLVQGLLDVVLSVPFLIAALNPAPLLHTLEWAGVGMWLVALAGETLADRQLEAWKAGPALAGGTCEVGLWRYSRHPNYFFEWLVWCAFALFALASPWGFLALACPALMLYFLLRVTGIPATEAQALRTRGDAYREYQRTTSAFVPLPRPRR